MTKENVDFPPIREGGSGGGGGGGGGVSRSLALIVDLGLSRVVCC